MTQKAIKINMEQDLEARPVAMLVQLASQYQSSIYLELGDKRVNAKSIMGIMSLCLNNGEAVTVSASGPDEEAAVMKLNQYLTGMGS